MANHYSHASLPYPIYNARFTLLIPYLNALGDPTDPGTPDTEFSLNGGAFADCAEEVTTISGGNGIGWITLTGAETAAPFVALAAKVASGPKTTLATLYPRILPIAQSGTMSAGSAGGGTIDAVAWDVTNCFIRTTGGTGGGGTSGANNQARRIHSYSPFVGTFSVNPDWEVTPDNTTTYEVLLPEGFLFSATEQLSRRYPIVQSDGGNSATQFKTNLPQTVDDHWKFALCMFMDGALSGQVRKVTGYVGATKILTFTDGFTSTPGNGDTAALINY